MSLRGKGTSKKNGGCQISECIISKVPSSLHFLQCKNKYFHSNIQDTHPCMWNFASILKNEAMFHFQSFNTKLTGGHGVRKDRQRKESEIKTGYERGEERERGRERDSMEILHMDECGRIYCWLMMAWYSSEFRFRISRTGPSSRVNAFLPRLAHLRRPWATTVATRGLSFKSANSKNGTSVPSKTHCISYLLFSRHTSKVCSATKRIN